MMGPTLPILLALAGCDLINVTGNARWNDPVDGDCDIIVESTWPVDGARDVFYRDAISFELSRHDPNAKVFFSAPGTQRFVGEDREIVLFSPIEPLDLERSYKVGLDYCHGSPTISFETSDIGKPIEDVSGLLGQTYQIDLDRLRFTKNEGFGEFIASWYGRDILLQVTWFDGTNMGVRLAVPTLAPQALDQDYCYRTFDEYGLKLNDESDVSFDSPEVAMEFYQSDLSLYDVEVGVTIGPELYFIDGGSISAWMNIGGLTAALDMGDTRQVCEFIEALGSDCEPCPYNSRQSCVHVVADRLRGEAVGIQLERILERDTDPRCPLTASDCLAEEGMDPAPR